MKLNRKLVLVLSLLLSVALATGGTLAYLSDTDADVNVMTLGNVYIVQNEQEWNEDKTELQPFTQEKPLLPYVGELNWVNDEKLGAEYRRFTMENVVDKYVTVTNTGKSDAYVRTIIALEMGEYKTIDEYKYNIIGTSTNSANGAQYQFTGTWAWDEAFVAQIDGKNFMVMVATHQNALKPEETTIPSLLQVYLNKNCGNEEVEKVDGNGDGKLNILVLSQAVQTNGFENAATALVTAFGKVDADNVANVNKWMGTGKDNQMQVGSPDGDLPGGWEDNNPPEFADVTVTTDAELLAAIQDAETDVICIDGDLTYDWGGDSYANSKALLLKGKTIQGKDVTDSITFKGYGSANDITDATFRNITIKDATVGDNEGAWEHGHLEFVNLTARNVVFANSIMLKGDSTLTGCSMDNQVGSWYGVWVDGGNATFTDCEFTGTRAIKIHEAYGSEVESVTVTDCTFTLSQKPGVVIGDLNADTTVTITGSTFDTTAGDQGLYIYETDTDVSTFKFSETGNTVK